MAFQLGTYNPDPYGVRTATAGAALTHRYGVYLSAEDTIQHSSGFATVGITKDSYDSGYKSCEYDTRGDLIFIAGAAITLDDQLISDPSTAGRFITAPAGIRGYGKALTAASAAADKCLGRFDFMAAGIEEQIQAQYYDSAIAADDSFTFNGPAGDYLVWLYISETAGNGFTVKVGTTDGGTEIHTSAITASTDYWKVPSDMTAQPLTFTLNDTIYVTSASWSSASIKLWMLAKRVA